MSTNHTPNYALSQWQASDQVLRTDFNEDNAKIDAALARIDKTLWNRFKPELLQEIPLEAGGNVFTIDMTGVDWSAWAIVLVVAHIPHTGHPENSIVTTTSQNLYIVTGNSSDHILAFYTDHSADGPIRCIGFPGGRTDYNEAAYTGMNQLKFTLQNMGALEEKAKVLIYGL